MENNGTKVKKTSEKVKETSNQSTVPEAIASVTYNLNSPRGYPVLFTIRRDNESELLETMEALEMLLEGKGYTPKTYKKFEKKPVDYVEGRVCPRCGGRLVNKVSKSGKKFIKCEKGKWDFVNKKAIGCDYVEWEENQAPRTAVSQLEPATQPQANLIKTKWPELWRDGLTKTEATQLIRESMDK